MMRRVYFAACVTLFVVAASGPARAASDGPPFRQGEVVVQGTPASLAGYAVKKYLPHANLSVVAVESGREWGQIQKLRAQGRRAGLNVVASAFSTVNDPYFDPYQWNFSAVQAEAAWDITDGGAATVGVLDTGLATAGASDGIACVVPGYDIVNGDNDPVDGEGHGTHVSGTIAAASNNGVGVAGLAHGACIMPVKVLDDSGSGAFADIADGIYWAVDNGADVINMSLGIAARYAIFNDPVLDPALDYAYAHNVTVVCAAGNDGSRKNVSYPGSYVTTIAVGATDYLNNVVRYSNQGTGLDVVAPGGDTSADRNGDGYNDGILQETFSSGTWGYYFFQGTSMASPHVAAIAAMLIAAGNVTTPDEVKNALTSTALDVEGPGFDNASAWGLVQAYAALTQGGCVPTESPVELSCQDGIDNDCDSLADAADPDCQSSTCTPTESSEVSCNDGIDNDCDGLTDAADPDCQSGGQCLPHGDACSANADCCSGSCKGKPGSRTCK